MSQSDHFYKKLVSSLNNKEMPRYQD